MSQNQTTPVAITSISGATILQQLSDRLESVNCGWSGVSAPANPVIGQRFVDTDDKCVFRWNGSVWVRERPLYADASAFEWFKEVGTLSATTTVWMPSPRTNVTVAELVIVSDTGSTSSSGNEWQVQVRNRTTGLNLISAAVGTYTYLASVSPAGASGNGLGTEITANTAWIITLNQNTAVGANAALDVVLTKSGTATSLTRMAVGLRGYRNGT